MEEGNLSYPNGRYIVDFEPGEDRRSFVLMHQVEGAPLINRLIEDQHASYVCVVSSPVSGYRETHIAGQSQQEVQWELDDLGEPPLFTPMIVCTRTCQLTLECERDGIHKIWDDLVVDFKAGSRLAVANVIQLRSSILQMLSMRKRDDLKEGTFFVDFETEPFLFVVNLSSGLHKFLRFAREERSRPHIMIHIVSACLALLQREFPSAEGEEGWKNDRSLNGLHNELNYHGIPGWGEDGFSPERAATILYPHKVPVDDQIENHG